MMRKWRIAFVLAGGSALLVVVFTLVIPGAFRSTEPARHTPAPRRSVGAVPTRPEAAPPRDPALEACCDALRSGPHTTGNLQAQAICGALLERGKPRDDALHVLFGVEKGAPLPARCCEGLVPNDRDYFCR